MSTFASPAPAISGPAEERHAFLKKTALWTLIGLRGRSSLSPQLRRSFA